MLTTLAATTPAPTGNGGGELPAYLAEVQAEVAGELDQLAAELAAEDRTCTELQARAYAAWEAGSEAEGDKLHDLMLKHLARATHLGERRNVLRTDEELQRRAQAKAAKAASRARLDTFLEAKANGEDE